VVAALGMANDFIIAHPDQALQILAMHFPSYSADVLRRSLGLVTFSPGARQTAAQWDNAVHTYVSAGLVKPTQAREGDAWTNQYTAPGSSTSPSPRESK
jgi:ABC-type nitrate/sulfonate/bicarbonate transport system substrate-binding protein